jgi:hypothetical protein
MKMRFSSTATVEPYLSIEELESCAAEEAPWRSRLPPNQLSFTPNTGRFLFVRGRGWPV